MEVILVELSFPVAAILRKYTRHFQAANFSLSRPIRKILHVCMYDQLGLTTVAATEYISRCTSVQQTTMHACTQRLTSKTAAYNIPIMGRHKVSLVL